MLPEGSSIRLLVSSHDVLHSWAVPSFGVKIDACPGRLNQVSLSLKRSGIFYGQCSELCGVNHGFMPIAVKVLPPEKFLFWVDFNINSYTYSTYQLGFSHVFTEIAGIPYFRDLFSELAGTRTKASWAVHTEYLDSNWDLMSGTTDLVASDLSVHGELTYAEAVRDSYSAAND